MSNDPSRLARPSSVPTFPPRNLRVRWSDVTGCLVKVVGPLALSGAAEDLARVRLAPRVEDALTSRQLLYLKPIIQAIALQELPEPNSYTVRIGESLLAVLELRLRTTYSNRTSVFIFVRLGRGSIAVDYCVIVPSGPDDPEGHCKTGNNNFGGGVVDPAYYSERDRLSEGRRQVAAKRLQVLVPSGEGFAGLATRDPRDRKYNRSASLVSTRMTGCVRTEQNRYFIKPLGKLILDNLAAGFVSMLLVPSAVCAWLQNPPVTTEDIDFTKALLGLVVALPPPFCPRLSPVRKLVDDRYLLRVVKMGQTSCSISGLQLPFEISGLGAFLHGVQSSTTGWSIGTRGIVEIGSVTPMPLQFHRPISAIVICDFSMGFRLPEIMKVRLLVIISRRRRISQLVTVVPLSTTPSNPSEPWHHQIGAAVYPLARGPMWAKCDMVQTAALQRLDRVRARDAAGRQVGRSTSYPWWAPLN